MCPELHNGSANGQDMGGSQPKRATQSPRSGSPVLGQPRCLMFMHINKPEYKAWLPYGTESADVKRYKTTGAPVRDSCTQEAPAQRPQQASSTSPALLQNRHLGSSVQTRRHGPSPAPESPRPTVWVAPENHISKQIPGLLVLLVWDPILRRWALRAPGMVDRWAGLGGRHLLPNPDE